MPVADNDRPERPGNPLRNITLRIEPYEMIPHGFGKCWVDHLRIQTVVAPFGINIVLRLAYGLWLWMLRPFRIFDAAEEAKYWKDRYISANT